MKLIIVCVGLFIQVVTATYSSYSGQVYYANHDPNGVSCYNAGNTLNLPRNTQISYPAGCSVTYAAATQVYYPSPTTVYTSGGPISYGGGSTVSYNAGQSVVYGPGTTAKCAQDSSMTFNSFNGSPYGIVKYSASTYCGYYGNYGSPTYYGPTAAPSNYYTPGGTTKYGQCAYPVQSSHTRYENNTPYTWTCTGFTGNAWPTYRVNGNGQQYYATGNGQNSFTYTNSPVVNGY